MFCGSNIVTEKKQYFIYLSMFNIFFIALEWKPFLLTSVKGNFDLVAGDEVFCILNSPNGKIRSLINCLLSYIIA